jgi:hypothetical protein
MSRRQQAFQNHSLHLVPRKRAVLMCPSIQPAAGTKSRCGRGLASETRFNGDRVEQGESDSFCAGEVLARARVRARCR